MKQYLQLILAAAVVAGCEARDTADVDDAGVQQPAAARQGTETADEFVDRINAELEKLNIELGAAAWVRATYITPDTAVLSSLASQKYSEWHSRSVRQSLAYADRELSPRTARAINLLKLGTAEPAPDDPEKREELAEITTDLAGMYGSGEYCPQDGRDCMPLGELERIMMTSRDYDQNLDAWTGWRTVAPPMREKYRRFAELANEGARELGYGDLGEMWKSGYDMSPARFEQESLRLWNQVKPLYDALHCHVRAKLGEHYGEERVPPGEPIPAPRDGPRGGATEIEFADGRVGAIASAGGARPRTPRRRSVLSDAGQGSLFDGPGVTKP